MDINRMDGYDFEKIVAELLKKMGFSVEHTAMSGDNGVDIIAYINQPIIKGKYIVQCKRWNKPVGEPVIRDLYGSMLNEHATKGILITNATFSNKARQFADGKNIELIDGSTLAKLFEKYEIEVNSSNTTKSFMDYPGFDKEQYLYLKSRVEENRRDRLYYDRLQQFYQSYIVDLSKYKINKSGLIDEYINFNNDYIKRFCKRTKENIARKKATLYINAFLYLLKGDIFKAVEIYDDIGIFDEILIYSRFNLEISDFVKCIRYNVVTSITTETRMASCRASIINLYSLFSYLSYKPAIDYIMDKIMTETAAHYSRSAELFHEKMPPIDQIMEQVKNSLHYRSNFFIPIKTYSIIRKYDRQYDYAMATPLVDKWWSFREAVSKYYENNEINTMRKELNKVNLILKDKKVNIYPKTKSEWMNKGDLLFNSQKYKEAIECYDKAIEINPEYFKAWCGKSIALLNLKKYEEEIECLNKAIEINPKDAELWVIKGNALASLKKYEEAIECYDKAIEIDPKDVYAWSNKGDALVHLKRYGEAIKCYDKVIDIDPEDAGIWIWEFKGLALVHLKRYREAIKCYDKVIDIDPEDANAWYNKGLALYHLMKYEEAVGCFSKAIKISPENAEVWNYKGMALLSLGKLKQKRFLNFRKNSLVVKRTNLAEAISCFDKVIELKWKTMVAGSWYYKACAYLLLGSKDNAIESLKQAVKLRKTFKRKAKEDECFASLQDDEEFKRIVS